MQDETKFKGYNPILQTFRTEGIPARISIDVSMDEWTNIRDIPLLEKGVMYEIIIKKIQNNA